MTRALFRMYAPLVVALLVPLAGIGLTLRPNRAVDDDTISHQQLPGQVRALASEVAAAGGDVPYALTLSDAELTTLARYFLTGTTGPFTRVQVSAIGGQLVVVGEVREFGIAIPVTLRLVVVTRHGMPAAAVDAVEGPLPAFARARIARQADALLDVSQYRSLVTVSAMELHPGALTLRGTARGRQASPSP